VSLDWFNLFNRALASRIEREPRLADPLQVGRFFAGSADGADGVVVDGFGPLVVLTVYNPGFVGYSSQMLSALEKVMGQNRFVLGKIRKPEGGFLYQDRLAILGKSWTAWEDDCSFEVRADDKNDFGLFPDARPARLALRSLVRPQSHVLNLFAYTCGFGVVARRAGAQAATNVDASADMLTWGKRNAALNNVDFAVVPELAQKYLQRLERRVKEGKVFCPDIWVCDPPAFGVGRGAQRLLKNFWNDFWGSVERLEPRSVLVLRNDRTGFRRGDTLGDELQKRFSGRYRIRPVAFDLCPSLCYERSDAFYKLNESLILFRD
jgi:23S rRNA (cytosine1962-C5)-methyltransferase